MTIAPLRLVPSLFQGANAAALRSVFQRYAQPGIILTDVALEVKPGTNIKTVVVGYAKESEGKLKKQLDPNDTSSWREHEFTRHEFRVKAQPGQDYVNTQMLLSKLALLKDR